MDDLFRQLAFINALLGGFAITFLSVLLTSSSHHRIINWTAAIVMVAASCFILSAVGSTFSAVVLGNPDTETALKISQSLRRPLSLLFLSGTVLLFCSLGLSGWMRSRNLGIATTLIAVLSAPVGCFIMRPFIH